MARQQTRRMALLFLVLESLRDLASAFPIALPIRASISAFGFRAIKRAAIAIRRHHAIGFKQRAGIAFVKQIDMAKADSANGVAMVRAVQREKARPF